MAETYGFFDAEELLDGTFDREYVAQQWANYFKLFIGNGVFATPTNQLRVRADSGMDIKVLEGWAFLNGYWYHNDGDLGITIPPNLTAVTQNHGVFVQFNSAERTITIALGVNRTEVDREAPLWEIKLGEISVPAGATSVTEANITDTRALNSVCGFVTGLIDVITTEDLFTQYQTIFDEWYASIQAEQTQKSEEFDAWMATEQQNMEDWETTQKNNFEDWEALSKEDFDGWFDEIKGQLSDDAAGNLQNQINIIDGAIANIQLTPSASRDFAEDEYIYWNRAFYRVTTDVSQDDVWDDTINIEPMPNLTSMIQEVKRTAGDMYKEDYDPDKDGIIGIAQGGTGNSDGYIRTGHLDESVTGEYSTTEGNGTVASGEASHAEGHSASSQSKLKVTFSTIVNYAEKSDFTFDYRLPTDCVVAIYTNYPSYRQVQMGNLSEQGSFSVPGIQIAGVGGESEYTTPGRYNVQVDRQYSPSENKTYIRVTTICKQAPTAGTEVPAFDAVVLSFNKPTTASGEASHAEGETTTASGKASHAEGSNTVASGNNSHAEGYGTIASGVNSHAEGVSTVASGNYSHAEGSNTVASGNYSHAEGHGTTARGDWSHVIGQNISDIKSFSFIFGRGVGKFVNTGMAEQGYPCFGLSMLHAIIDSDTTNGNCGRGYDGIITDTATLTLNLEVQAMYLLICSAYTIASGAIYGVTARLITAHGLSTGTPSNVSLGQTSAAPATIAVAANNKLTIKNTAATRVTQFHLIRLI